MGRREEHHYKDGVDYWNIDVDIFENKKIRLILGEFGIKGVYLYLLILNEIYRTCGYYKQWDRDDCLLMSASSGVAGDCSPQLIAEVVQGLVRRSLFDKGVLDRFGVLTSAEIQRRFLRIVGNSRSNIPMIQEYFLLDPDNRKDVTRATLAKIAFFSIASQDSAQTFQVFSQNLKDSDKEKKRTEKKRTEKNLPSSGRAGGGASSQPQKRKASSLTEEQQVRFRRFWAIYPRKQKLGDAEKAWAKLEPDDALTDRIVAAVQDCILHDYRFQEERFTPLPASWLNGKEWENQYGGQEHERKQSPGTGSGWDFRPSTGFKNGS